MVANAVPTGGSPERANPTYAKIHANADTIEKDARKIYLEEFMKKKLVPLIIALILAGCSGLSNLPFLQTPTPQAQNSPQPSVTLISDGYTRTPDLFATNTQAPTTTLAAGETPPTSTPFPTIRPTDRPTITLEPVDITLFTPGPNPFTLVSKSTSQIVWGHTCDGSRSIKFVVQVITPVRRLKYVTLWYRLQDKYSARVTDWGGGAIMFDNDRSTYFYTLELDQITGYQKFEDAWLQFQFVASNVYLHRLGSSVVDRSSTSVTHCTMFNP
jgi:hypothetical protein